MVKSYAQTICLKPDPAGIAEYKAYHANSWPEVLQALKTVAGGFQRTTIRTEEDVPLDVLVPSGWMLK
jgi:L-rhamnose mutarotase